MNLSFYFTFKSMLLVIMIISYSCHENSDSQNHNSETSDLIQIDPRNYLQNNFLLSDISTDVKYICLSDDLLVSTIKDLKVINQDIFIQVADTLLIKYDLEGKNPQIIGSYGRGPGEYQYISSFAVNYKTGTIYILERNRVQIYSNNGSFIGDFDINEDTGLRINDIEYFNSHLFLAQYIRGKEEYNWIIADTLGNIIINKKNNLPPIETREGRRGGIYKYANRISYWDSWTDTIFTVSPDSGYIPAGLFAPGGHRHLDLDGVIISSPQHAVELWKEVCNTLNILETTNYLVYNFFFKGQNGISFINKDNHKVLSNIKEAPTQGIDNDLDNGPGFTPHYYFQAESEEYLIGWAYAYRLKAYLESETFKNSTPKYPEKKRELEELAASLDINDNPVLMLVKLKG